MTPGDKGMSVDEIRAKVEWGIDGITAMEVLWLCSYAERSRANRDALVAAGDVLATRLDETPALGSEGLFIDAERLRLRQQAVRVWLAVAHPGGTGHKP